MQYEADLEYMPRAMTAFVTTVELMKQKCVPNDYFIVHAQEVLPGAANAAMARIEARASEIVLGGGEGLIIKNPNCYWRGERTHDMVKFKPTDDADGVVVGYVTGRETDKGSKLLGLMGALVLKLENGKCMELSGFTDAERVLQSIRIPEDQYSDQDATDWAISNPCAPCPDWIEAVHFPRGTVVTFKYRGVSDKGIYQEARYSHKRIDS
jgi:ATP-dependent DNA ligase